MTAKYFRLLFMLLIFFVISCATCNNLTQSNWRWETVDAKGAPTARHEASLVAHNDKLYLIGGRRVNPVDVFDPNTNEWIVNESTPIELHHFQAVSLGDAIYIIGAMTGQWPYETPVERVIAYYPDRDEYEFLHEIPENRRRGGAGIAIHDNKIYIIGGITNGHWDGSVAWLDEYDPETGEWRVLTDAPHLRDHFAAAVVDDKIYAFGGRRSRQRENIPFDLTVSYGDIYDISKGVWESVREENKIPTERAGGMAVAWGDAILIGGGESGSQVPAHNEVEAFNAGAHSWRNWPSLERGRHGSGFAIVGDYLYTASGSGDRGGEPELSSLERLRLPERPLRYKSERKTRTVYQRWHDVSLEFQGPESNETDRLNPFTDYRLFVEFTKGDKSHLIRGYYAGDGKAADTGAASGDKWRVHFSPDEVGEWRWRARLATGAMIAIDRDWDAGKAVSIDRTRGEFLVEPSDKDAPDFRARGKIVADNGYFRSSGDGSLWLKGGTNSPENLLAFKGFDNTYRMVASSREGEAETGEAIHQYKPHITDWHLGDPLWRGDKGKGLVGAINYLSNQGMNSAYFLTLNILGDGKDVWPYRDPESFTRFDVSKLDQWNRVFSHMQENGVLLHVVMQETENELMLDGGDVGPMRQLYYLELIARFAHHPGLVWNLGEENGPAHWLPEGQTTEQRIAMATFLKAHDPYHHPVLLHTHADPEDKNKLLTPLLGLRDLDGLSFQVAARETIAAETHKWRSKSAAAGTPWVITMDEVGLWHTGARHDDDDPTHDSLRRHALWGAFMGGAAGVEWYFGAHQKGNDITTEDLRSRANLWRQTRHALEFFNQYLSVSEMAPCAEAISANAAYCFAKSNDMYALYVIADAQPVSLNGKSISDEFTLHWYDPIAGGDLFEGTVKRSHDKEIQLIPPDENHDWVALLRVLP